MAVAGGTTPGPPQSSVKFAEDDHEEDEEESEEGSGAETDEDANQLFAALAKTEKVSVDESRMIQNKLMLEFVKEKKKKLNCCAKIYLGLQNCCVEKIMFKNKRAEIEKLLDEQLKGGIEVPTELEVIMMDEAKDMIEEKFDNLEGSKELFIILK